MDLVKFANKSTHYDLALRQEKCLRKYKTNSCDKCIQFCPADALKLKDKTIVLDENKCNNCGICLTTCPASAFEANPSLTITCINNISRHKMAIFACENSRQKNALGVSCLAGISSTVLVYGALNTGSSVLAVDQCAACPLCENAKAIIDKNVNDANAILSCLENSKSSVSISNSPFLIDRYINRSDFFNAVKATFMDISLETVMEKIAQENNQFSDIDILMNILDKQKLKKAVSELPFFTLGLNDSCNYCLKCTFICPTGAVYSALDGSYVNLYFESKKCSGCNMCLDACPGDCLSVSNKTDLGSVDKIIVLGHSTANFCQTCSELIPSDKVQCSNCGKKEGLIKNLQKLF